MIHSSLEMCRFPSSRVRIILLELTWKSLLQLVPCLKKKTYQDRISQDGHRILTVVPVLIPRRIHLLPLTTPQILIKLIAGSVIDNRRIAFHSCSGHSPHNTRDSTRGTSFDRKSLGQTLPSVNSALT